MRFMGFQKKREVNIGGLQQEVVIEKNNKDLPGRQA